MREVDILIVGQGLAGTILYDYAIENGFSALIVDKCREITSSKVAAGIMNPITGRRFAKTWLADEIFSHATNYYEKKELQLQTKFYYSLPVHRYLSSIEDQNTWMGRSVDEDIQQFIGKKEISIPTQIKATFGGAEIIGGGYINTSLFLESARKKISNSESILDEDISIEALSIGEKEVIWNNTITAKKIIFCEGFRAIDNPLFSWLPFTFAKGEIFDLKIENLPADRIYNKNGFIMPVKGDFFRMGATYRWNEMNESITERSKDELIEKLEKIINCKYQIINQQASIRPTVKDRRPFIGAHPNYKNVYIFNGFGSKGVTLIPYFASHFIRCLQKKEALMKDVNIERYYSCFNQ